MSDYRNVRFMFDDDADTLHVYVVLKDGTEVSKWFDARLVFMSDIVNGHLCDPEIPRGWADEAQEEEAADASGPAPKAKAARARKR
jgi:hypothetical protein